MTQNATTLFIGPYTSERTTNELLFIFITRFYFFILYILLRFRNPDFIHLLEEILLNTLQNLMTEASLGEMILTSRPRTIESASRRRHVTI